jgi:small ligand-binding sensory domain FIST
MILAASGQKASADEPLLSFSSHARLPFDWQADAPRAGFLDSDGVTWAHSRVADHGCAELRLPGMRSRPAISTGLRPLGTAQTVDQCRGYELGRVGGHRAVDSLYRVLPAELRQYPPLHQIVLLRHPEEPGIAILSANGDGSLMLADSLENGDAITWAIRQPLTAEQQTRESLSALAQTGQRPDFALMFSCIGRGPLFYGDDDRDLLAFRETFPDTPLLGAYGTGQIIPCAGNNRLYHNAVLTLLFESSHV